MGMQEFHDDWEAEMRRGDLLWANCARPALSKQMADLAYAERLYRALQESEALLFAGGIGNLARPYRDARRMIADDIDLALKYGLHDWQQIWQAFADFGAACESSQDFGPNIQLWGQASAEAPDYAKRQDEGPHFFFRPWECPDQYPHGPFSSKKAAIAYWREFWA